MAPCIALTWLVRVVRRVMLARSVKVVAYRDGSHYEGDWRDGGPDGVGVFVIPGEVRYVGGFKRGVKHGEGSERFAEGQYYSGGWRDDRQEGIGVMRWPADGRRYSGQWRKGVPHGAGRVVLGSGKRISVEFRGGVPVGIGHVTLPDGTRYKTDFGDQAGGGA